MMAKISFVYFDVGGVIIKDYSNTNKWEIMKNDLGATGDLSKKFETIFRQYNDRLTTGSIDVDKLLNLISQKLGLTISKGFSLLDYFVAHFEQNQSIWPAAKIAQSKVKVGLLTDQYLGMLDKIKTAKLLPPAKWNIIIDSSLVKVKKPMPAIYQLAASRTGVPANEILFVDNLQKNLDGAKKAGWQTYFYDSANYLKSSQELLEFFRENL